MNKLNGFAKSLMVFAIIICFSLGYLGYRLISGSKSENLPPVQANKPNFSQSQIAADAIIKAAQQKADSIIKAKTNPSTDVPKSKQDAEKLAKAKADSTKLAKARLVEQKKIDAVKKLAKADSLKKATIALAKAKKLEEAKKLADEKKLANEKKLAEQKKQSESKKIQVTVKGKKQPDQTKTKVNVTTPSNDTKDQKRGSKYKIKLKSQVSKEIKPSTSSSKSLPEVEDDPNDPNNPANKKPKTKNQ